MTEQIYLYKTFLVYRNTNEMLRHKHVFVITYKYLYYYFYNTKYMNLYQKFNRFDQVWTVYETQTWNE